MLPADLRAQLDTELGALARLDGIEGIAPDYLRFCEAVARSQAAARAAARATISRGTSATTTMPPATRRLRRDLVALDERPLHDLLDDLVRAAHITAPDEDPLRILADAADEEPELLVQLAAAAVFDDDAGLPRGIAERLGLPAPALRFVGRLLAQPFVAEARHRRGPIPELDARNVDTPEAGRCPTCASPPALAVLCRDDGRRRLECGLCGDTWLVPRLMCVACGNRDQSRLATLTVRGHDASWVETCEACRRYLKTVDERRLPEDHILVLRAEEAASLLLDLLAEDAGYVRPDGYGSPLLEMTL